MFFVLYIFGYGIHGTRSVQGYACDYILKARRLQVFHELCHSAGFQLEYSRSVSGSDHLIHGGIVISHFGEVYLNAVLSFYHLQGVPYDCQVP